MAPYIASSSWAKSPPSERVRHASFGGSGMAGTDLGQIKTHPNVEMVAVAEIDPNRRRQAQARLRGSKIYSDWREMLDKEGKNLNSVNVSTPDHMHASMAMSSMQLGLHVYGQKPLAHDVYEVRRQKIQLLARRSTHPWEQRAPLSAPWTRPPEHGGP